MKRFDFRCANCDDWYTWKHLAFTFKVDVEGKTENHGVCGYCATPEGSH